MGRVGLLANHRFSFLLSEQRPSSLGYSVEIGDLGLELRLAPVARMPHANYWYRIRNTVGSCCGIIPDGNNAGRMEEENKLLEQLFSSLSFSCVMLTICKLIPRFMRMEREDIPKEDPSIDLFQHAPYDGGGPLGNGAAFSRTLCGHIKIPAFRMLAHVNIVS